MAVHAADCNRSANFRRVHFDAYGKSEETGFVQIVAEQNTERIDGCAGSAFGVTKEAYKVRSRLYSPMIRQALKYIHSRRFQPLSAGDEARFLHVERTSFTKRFNRETGLTMTDFIHTMKMDVAEEMIHSRNYSLLEVSDLLKGTAAIIISVRSTKSISTVPRRILLTDIFTSPDRFSGKPYGGSS